MGIIRKFKTIPTYKSKKQIQFLKILKPNENVIFSIYKFFELG
jgi:hypothetical protein